MKLPSAKIVRRGLILIGVIVVLCASLAAAPYVKQWARAEEKNLDVSETSALQVVRRSPLTVRVVPDTVRALAMQAVPVQPATAPRPLRMVGQLAIDTDHLIRIKPFFAGKVAQIAPARSISREGATLGMVSHPLRAGDPVEPHQLLAIYWSKDLGQAKSALVDAWSRLLVDQRYLDDLRTAPDAVPQKTLRDSERAVDSDRIAVNAAERQLRAWNIPEEEIGALKKEGRLGGSKDKDQWQKWASFEIRAPGFPGIIVEKNATEGENIDPSAGPPLFQIADYRQMAVYAYPYEEDLPALEQYRTQLRKRGQELTWKITLKADPTRQLPEGKVDRVLPIVDPNQKTPILRGYVQDPDGNLNPRLLSTMSVIAEIQLPPTPGQVMVPASALVDDGEQSVVFVQLDPRKPEEYTLQPVDVLARYADRVFIRAHPVAAGMEPAAAGSLESGQRVLTSGAVELKAAVDDLPPESAQHKS